MATVGITSLEKRFDGALVLNGVTLSVADGELVTLLGPSGCGKTTTLRCVAGLERPDGGEIHIGGRLVASGAPSGFVPANRRGIGMVFQSYALWPHMTVFSNVAYPLKVRRADRKDIRKKVMEVLASVGMDALAQRSVAALSGGQQQRVALARAMVASPGVLLFDEPLSNLDAKLRLAMRKEIRLAHERSGATSIYVTHDQEEAIALSDRVVVLDRGAIQQVGTPRSIYRRPTNRFVADFLGFENILPATVREVRDDAVALTLDGVAGAIWATATHGFARGGAAYLAVRAEDLVLDAPSAQPVSNAAALACTVQSSVYVGDSIEHAVVIGASRFVVRTPETDERLDERFVEGSAALLRFPPARTVALVRDTTDEGEPDVLVATDATADNRAEGPVQGDPEAIDNKKETV